MFREEERGRLAAVILCAGLVLIELSPSATVVAQETDRRLPGDCNQDRVVDVTDATVSLRHQFFGEDTAICLRSCDVNGDGLLSIADPVLLLFALFLDAPMPGPPPLLDCPGVECGRLVPPEDPPATCPRFDASAITIEWDPVQLDVSGTPEEVAGYRVYVGTRSRQYDCVHDVGPALRHQISDLLRGVTYHISVTAYDTAGNESAFSGEICMTPE